MDRLLVAVSGGADSVGLLALLADELGYSTHRLVVGHVNHSIRADAAEDLAVVRRHCEQRGVPVSPIVVDALRLARSERISLEAASRRLRYRALEGIAREHDCRWIVTGHTRDDSAETVLWRMLGGGPWHEWAGIPSRRGRILRPLIAVPRPVLRQWVRSRGLEYREDASNVDPRHLRNRLRLVLQKKQEFWTESRINKLAEGGQLLWWSLSLARMVARSTLAECGGGSGEFGLEIERIFGYFNNLAFVPIEAAWAELAGQSEARFPSATRRQILAFLRGASPEAVIKLPDGIVCLRRGSRVWLFREPADFTAMRVGMGRWSVPARRAALAIAESPATSAAFICAIDPQCTSRELWLRPWQAGDRIKLPHRPTKNVADLLNENKCSPLTRARQLVLADERGPLLLVGGAVAERALPPPDRKPVWVSWVEDDGTS